MAVMDQAVTAALAQRLGHPPPFDAAELAHLDGALQVTGARNLEGLGGCHRLSRLGVHASDVDDLSVIAALPGLRRLRISATPVSDLAPLAGHAGLAQVELLFTFAEDATAVRELSALRQGQLIGNPWTAAKNWPAWPSGWLPPVTTARWCTRIGESGS